MSETGSSSLVWCCVCIHWRAIQCAKYFPLLSLFQIYRGGKLTQLIKGWSVGVLAEWRGPFGEFRYQMNQYKQLGMLACGTGIAPMVQVIQAVLDDEDDFTSIQLVYACRTQHDVLMKDRLDQFSGYWNFHVLYVLSQTTDKELMVDKGLIHYADRVKFGRIDADMVQDKMPPPSADHHVLVCGTKSFDKDMMNHLLKMGYQRKQIFKF